MTIIIMFGDVKASYDGRSFDIGIHPSIPLVDITQICAIIKTLYEKTTECKNSATQEKKKEITTLQLISPYGNPISQLKNDIVILLFLLTQPYGESLFRFFINKAIEHIQLLPAVDAKIPYGDKDHTVCIKLTQ